MIFLLKRRCQKFINFSPFFPREKYDATLLSKNYIYKLLGHFGGCTSSNPCAEDEGDCDSDSQCKEGLKCGTDNCPANSTYWPTDDCCFAGCKPH